MAQNQKEKAVTIRPFWGFPLLEDSFWDLDIPSSSGLSLSEDKDRIYVEAALPGLKPENIEISVEKNVLWIKGEKKEEEQDKEKKYYRKASGSYSYRVQLPEQVDDKKDSDALYKDGIIKITFQKSVGSQPKKINIKTK